MDQMNIESATCTKDADAGGKAYMGMTHTPPGPDGCSVCFISASLGYWGRVVCGVTAGLAATSLRTADSIILRRFRYDEQVR